VGGVESAGGRYHHRMPSFRARILRKNAIDAERRLWRCLRQKQIDGFRFRRQQPIGPYIGDFFCPQAALILEIDGGQHAAQETEDSVRTAWLEARGYRVLRFWNNDVLRNTPGVLVRIGEALRDGPPPLPSPSRGEGVDAVKETS
jgi:very-short-patch-repair endonuclease